MAKNLQVAVADKRATLIGDGSIVCGNSDYTITFLFDDDWADYTTKTARFFYYTNNGPEYVEAPFSGWQVAVPVLSGITEVWVGVYAGELQTTTKARIPCHPSILCAGGQQHAEPDPDVYAQLLALLQGGGDRGASAFTSTEVVTEAQQVITLQSVIKPDGFTLRAGDLLYAANGRLCVVLDITGESVTVLSSAVTIGIPPVTAADNGKYMRVVDGVWKAETISMAEEAAIL